MTPNVGGEKKRCSNFNISCFTGWPLGRLHSCIHVLSAQFLLLSLLPADPRAHFTHSPFPQQPLVSASPFLHILPHNHWFCVSPSPSSQLFCWWVVLSPQHPHQLPPALCPSPDRKSSQNSVGQLPPYFAFQHPMPVPFPELLAKQELWGKSSLPSTLSSSLPRWQGLHSWREVGGAQKVHSCTGPWTIMKALLIKEISLNKCDFSGGYCMPRCSSRW